MVPLLPNEEPERRKVQVKMPITVCEFAEAAHLKPYKVIADLMEAGFLTTMNQKLAESALVLLGQKNNLDIEIIPPSVT